MHERASTLGIVNQQRPVPEPLDQVLGIAGLEDIGECVTAAQFACAGRHGQHVQIMIAEHAFDCVSEFNDVSQHVE